MSNEQRKQREFERMQKELTKTALEQMSRPPQIIKVLLPEKPVDKGFIDLDTIE